MTRIPIRNFWGKKITKYLYELAAESGSQIATAHSWLTRRLAQTLSNFGCASGTFRISFLSPKVKNCSVHENQDVEAHGSLKQALAAVFQNIEFLHKNLLRTPITLDLGIGCTVCKIDEHNAT